MKIVTYKGRKFEIVSHSVSGRFVVIRDCETRKVEIVKSSEVES